MVTMAKTNQWMEVLREKAEKIAAESRSTPVVSHAVDMQSLLHELHVYHIELETQNRELRETQRLLESSQRKYYELFDLAPVGYVILTDQGAVEEVNLTLCDMLEADRIQIKDKPFVIYVAPEGHSAFYDHLHQVLQARRRSTANLPLRAKSGRVLTTRVETVPVYEDSGTVKHLLVTITDISELQQAYENLATMTAQLKVSERGLKIRNDVATVFLTSAEEETLRQLLQIVVRELSTRMAVIVLEENEQLWCTSVEMDQWGQALSNGPSVSPPCQELCKQWRPLFREGFEVQVYNGRTFEFSTGFVENLLIHPIQYQDVRLGLLAAANRAEPFTEQDIHTVRIIVESLAPLLHARWQKQREETERRRLEAEQRRLEKRLHETHKMEAIGRLAGGIAHDFNNNLQVILGRTDILFQFIGPNDPAHTHLEEIHKAGLRSAELVRQLLTFARKQLIAPRPVQLNDAIAGLLKMLRRLIGENIEIVWKPGPALWPVRMDPAQVDQILANLCVNARDAIEGEGQILIETRNVSVPENALDPKMGSAAGDYVLLAVSDTGSGMDEETLQKIFEPFFTTKDMGKGTGLGLATVYGIVKQNKGHITVHSEPGRGSRFTIYLPRCSEEVSGTDQERAAHVPMGRGETVLVVEDDPAILTMVGAMLEQLGYTVLSASHPLKALEIALHHEKPLDVLLTDVIMPDMNGRILAEEVQRLRHDIKILFMSGYVSESLLTQNVGRRNVAFLKKPFSRADLARTMRFLLEASPSGPDVTEST